MFLLRHAVQARAAPQEARPARAPLREKVCLSVPGGGVRLCQLKCTVAGMKMKKMVVGAGNAANGEEMGTNRAAINGTATQLELRNTAATWHGRLLEI